jgi:hypothetical protein
VVEANHGEQVSSQFPESFVAYLLKCTASDSKGAKIPSTQPPSETVASHMPLILLWIYLGGIECHVGVEALVLLAVVEP